MPKTTCHALPQSDFLSQYKRILEAAECTTQAELTAILEVKQSSIAEARRRRHIPAIWRVKLFKKKHINPEWLLSGTSVKYLVPSNSKASMPHVVKVVEVRPPTECSAQDLFSELVRRSMEPLNVEEIQKEIAETWRPVSARDNDL